MTAHISNQLVYFLHPPAGVKPPNLNLRINSPGHIRPSL